MLNRRTLLSTAALASARWPFPSRPGPVAKDTIVLAMALEPARPGPDRQGAASPSPKSRCTTSSRP
jgi:peptide/nickel transport system substrate-binding protein